MGKLLQVKLLVGPCSIPGNHPLRQEGNSTSSAIKAMVDCFELVAKRFT